VRVPVIGLIGRAGERRPLVGDVDPAELGDEPWGVVEAVEGPVHLDLTLEAVAEGVLVRGGVDAVLRVPCARCLAPTLLPRRAEVTELHRRTGRGPARGPARAPEDDPDEPADDEAYLLVDGDRALELDRMVRDALLLDVPVRVLCRPDCAGLCPVCGADRGADACRHGDEGVVDPRWAALRVLRDRLGADADAVDGPGPGPGAGPDAADAAGPADR